MSDQLDTAAALARAHAQATVTLTDVAILLTTSLHRVYDMAKTGSLPVDVIHVGSKNLRCPSKPLLKLIGELDTDDTEGGAT